MLIDVYLHRSSQKQGLATDSRCTSRTSDYEDVCQTRRTSDRNRDSSKTQIWEADKEDVLQMVPIQTPYLLWFPRSVQPLQLTMWWSDKIPTTPESLCSNAPRGFEAELVVPPAYTLLISFLSSFDGSGPIIEISPSLICRILLLQGIINVPSLPNLIFEIGNMQNLHTGTRACCVQSP